jgi:pimeloyl-ACP methyl ester carboxylesterase
MHVVTKDGTKLFVRDWGRGEPLLFLASAGVSSDIWSHTIPACVDAGYRCISFDRRGHGRSDEPRGSGGWDIDTLANDVGSIVERLELSAVSLVGHSLGGAEAIRYAARSGAARVRKLVLLAPTAPFMTRTPDNPDGVDRTVFEALWDAWRKDFPGWARANARPFFDEGTSEAMMDWGVALLTSTPLYVHLELARTITGSDLRQDLPRISAPTLFLHGEKDASVPVAFGRSAAQLVRDGRFQSYPSAAHGLFITHANEVNEETLAFLRR